MISLGREVALRAHTGWEIEQTAGQIDRLVYKLYGLMEEEVRVVDGK